VAGTIKMANFKIPTSGFIEFEQIPYLVEIFPSPIMQALKTVSHHVKDRNDLLRSSNQLKFHELFVPEKNIIEATIKGIKVKVSANDFMTWQLERASSETLLEVINKTDASVTEILDYEKEYKNNPDYDPENWLNIYNQEQRENGILYIDRLRTDASKLFYDEVARAILDKNYGMVGTKSRNRVYRKFLSIH
jgi:hypothetical protein